MKFLRGENRMKSRKEIKKEGRKILKKHYVIFVGACLVAAFLGAEFSGSLHFSEARNYDHPSSETRTDSENTDNAKTALTGVSWEKILQTIADGSTQAGRQLSEQAEQNEIAASEKGNPAFGRTRGVLADLVNQVSSGSILVTLTAALISLTGSTNMGILLLILLGAAGAFAFWFLIINVFQVVIRRVFLEGMNYERVSTERFVFLLRVKKWLRASWIMFVKYVYYTLWSLTIVGLFVKRYSYYLVPFIAAENPDMSARQAITLSRRMMKGHKWECFVYEFSFVGWHLLGLMTLGLFSVFYTNPYVTASSAVYYAELRKKALEEEIPGSELLFDTYLYEKPSSAVIREKYADVMRAIRKNEEDSRRIGGWRGFLADNFGILLMPREQERTYEKHQAEYVRLRTLVDDAEGRAYPVRLYPIPEKQRRKLVQSLNYMRHYSIWSLMAIFLSMSVFGWLWEVGLTLVESGELVNRGVLHGPWLPIYGSGAVLILTLLNRFRRNPAMEFSATIVVCGILEYTTSWVLQTFNHGMKWWDYSGYFLNLNGRICAEGLLVFGIGGLAIVYILAPIIDNAIAGMNRRAVRTGLAALMVLFVSDAAYSHFYPNEGKGITDTASLPVRDTLLSENERI